EINVFAVHLDPLAPTRDVGRGVGADRQACSRQEGGCPSRRRRLAVRADDVDCGVSALRLAELGEQVTHPPQAELLGPGRKRLDELSLRGHRARAGTWRASRARL